MSDLGDHISRRAMLQRSSLGFGAVALDALFGRTANAAARPARRARAKNVIFCYMSGGVSHVDSFDPKPRLRELHGKPMPVAIERTQFNNNGKVMASPFSFAQHGESGLWVSSMFPELAKVADELAVIRSMTAPFSEHAQGNFLMHTGFPFIGHPSAGAWIHYGLGSENENLPGFLTICPSYQHGGVQNYSSAFLPAAFNGTPIGTVQQKTEDATIEFLDNQTVSPATQRAELDLLQRWQRRQVERTGPDHAQRFTVRVSVHKVGEAQGSVTSKGEAEKTAAQAFMEQFG